MSVGMRAGRLLGQQNVEELEIHGSDDYEAARFAQFIERWRRDGARVQG